MRLAGPRTQQASGRGSCSAGPGTERSDMRAWLVPARPGGAGCRRAGGAQPSSSVSDGSSAHGAMPKPHSVLLPQSLLGGIAQPEAACRRWRRSPRRCRVPMSWLRPSRLSFALLMGPGACHDLGTTSSALGHVPGRCRARSLTAESAVSCGGIRCRGAAERRCEQALTSRQQGAAPHYAARIARSTGVVSRSSNAVDGSRSRTIMSTRAASRTCRVNACCTRALRASSVA